MTTRRVEDRHTRSRTTHRRRSPHQADTAGVRRRSILPRWRATLRLSLRQLRRTPGSTVLVTVLIALPIVSLSALAVFFQSHQPTPQQRAETALGRFDSVVMAYNPPHAGQHQSLTDLWSWETTADAEPTTGERPTTLPNVVPSSATVTSVSVFDRVVIRTPSALIAAQLTGGAVWLDSFAGRYELTRGRPPRGSDEALASAAFLERIDATVGDTLPTTSEAVPALTITGVLADAEGDPPLDLAVTENSPLLSQTTPRMWFISGWQPSLEEFTELNAQGYAVLGRDLILHPPASYPGPVNDVAGSAIPVFVIAAAGAAFMATVVALVCGAAFSVSARRQQRSLAMAASVGAARGDLRGIVIGQGLVIGVLAGILGVVLGIGAVALLLELGVGDRAFGRVWGLHVPWQPLLALVAFAVIIAFAAAVMPARAATRGDVLVALRGARRPVELRRALPRWGVGVLVAGLSATATGIVMMVATTTGIRTSALATAAGILVVAGPLLGLIGVGMSGHWLITTLARWCARAGVATRLATRDAAANPARTVPAFLAIASAVFLAVAGMAVQSVMFGATARSHYWDAPLHAVRIDVELPDADERQRILVAAEDLLRRAEASAVATLQATDGRTYSADTDELSNPEQLIASLGWYDGSADCACVDGFFPGSEKFFVAAASDLPTIAGIALSPAEQRAYDSGAVIVPPGSVTANPAGEGRIFLMSAQRFHDLADQGDTTTLSRDLGASHAVPVLRPQGLRFSTGPIISPQTAASLGLAVAPVAAVGAFPDALALPVLDRLTLDATNLLPADSDARSGHVGVLQEGGPGSGAVWLVLIAGVALVIVIGTALVTLGLARFERRPDDATLTAVGSTRAVRRRINVMQALIIVGIGSATGAALGVLPGYAFVTASSSYFSAADMPLVWIGCLAVALPLVVATIAWLVPPPRPDLTRRTAIT